MWKWLCLTILLGCWFLPANAYEESRGGFEIGQPPAVVDPTYRNELFRRIQPPPALQTTMELVYPLFRYGEVVFTQGTEIHVVKVIGYRPGEFYEVNFDLLSFGQFCSLLGFRYVIAVGYDVSEATVIEWMALLESLGQLLRGGGCPG